MCSVRVRWIFGMYSWHEQRGDGDRVKVLGWFISTSSGTAGGSTDCFPRSAVFLFFSPLLLLLVHRLTEPILTNFRLKPFSAQAQGSWRTGQATSMDVFFFVCFSLIMAPWASTVIYKVPQESGAKQYQEETSKRERIAVPLKAKQEKIHKRAQSTE